MIACASGMRAVALERLLAAVEAHLIAHAEPEARAGLLRERVDLMRGVEAVASGWRDPLAATDAGRIRAAAEAAWRRGVP